jgi:hypothetical protein
MSTVRGAYYGGIVKNGLILDLDAAKKDSYPKAGTTWTDISGNKNNGTLINGPTFDNRNGGSIVFDGSNDYVSVSYNATSMAAWSTAQTVIFWEYHDFTTGRRNIWNQAYGGYGTWTCEGGNSISYYYGNSGTDNSPYTFLASPTISTGRWNMLVITRDVSQVKWYVNNNNVTTMSNPYGVLANTTTNINIGNGYTGTPWVGRIAIVQAYNRALTAAEVSQNYNALKGRFGL